MVIDKVCTCINNVYNIALKSYYYKLSPYYCTYYSYNKFVCSNVLNEQLEFVHYNDSDSKSLVEQSSKTINCILHSMNIRKCLELSCIK